MTTHPPRWPGPSDFTDLAQRQAGLTPALVDVLAANARAMRDGHPDVAMAGIQHLLAAAPDHPEALRVLAIAQLRRGQTDAARRALQTALAQWPNDPLALTDLGNLEHATDHPQAALAAWRAACASAPHYAMAWFNLGRYLQTQGQTAAAIDALEHACALDARLLPAHVLYGDACVHLGRFDAAEHAYRAALAVHPACGDAWRGLANIKTRPLAEADRDRLAALLAAPDTAEPDRIAIGFALGKLEEDRGHPAAAFAALTAANAAQYRLAPWRAEGFHALVQAVVAASDALPMPLDPTLGHEIIFIVGMPRSGSTLCEQILAAHPQVEGASELPDLGAVLAEESARRGQPYPRWVASASAADWHRLGQRYLDRTARWRTQRPRATDKLPENWLHTGVLAAMLPGAHLIDTRRDALETAWSCFKQQFYRLPHFACRFTDLAAYLNDYRTAMQHWQTRMPTRIHVLQHEALLAEPRQAIRALLDFCGLPFDPQCMDFSRTTRAVRTPSAAQVRQPLQRNTAHTPMYAALLDPLRAALATSPPAES